MYLFTSCGQKEMQKAEYAGEDISGAASILRDKETKKAQLKVEFAGKWTLYGGSSVESIDFTTPIAEGNKEGLYDLNVNDTVRSYFQLVTEKGKAILAERHLPMTGGYNFRDMGGFKTQDGKYVKWGKVFRSDDLHKLTDADLRYLAHIPMISIVDFRADDEIQLAPDRIPSSAKSYTYSISPGNLASATIEHVINLPANELDSIMIGMNKLFVTDAVCINQYKAFFKLLQNEKNVPLMFHCSAGKDRTGMGAALFLFSLGVDEETIMADYLSSNVYLGDKYAGYIKKYPNLRALMGVDPEFLKSGIDQIKKDHGSVDAYLTNVLEVDTAKMKSLYLY